MSTTEILKTAEEKMQKAFEAMCQDFAVMRAGRADPAILDKLQIDYYGTPTPVAQMANISAPEPRLLLIQPWDRSMIKAIEKAINTSDLGINPSNDGAVIRLSIPPLTEERRKELAKQCRTYAEESRVAVRNARRDANAAIERAQKNDGLPEDEAKRAEAEVQKLTDKYVADVDAAVKAKEAEVMEV